MKYAYLRIGSDDYDEAQRCVSVAEARREFSRVARGLARFGQSVNGTIHLAARRSDMAEYPDYVLSVGERGGIVVEKT